jgi:hypothetical protein
LSHTSTHFVLVCFSDRVFYFCLRRFGLQFFYFCLPSSWNCRCELPHSACTYILSLKKWDFKKPAWLWALLPSSRNKLDKFVQYFPAEKAGAGRRAEDSGCHGHCSSPRLHPALDRWLQPQDHVHKPCHCHHTIDLQMRIFSSYNGLNVYLRSSCVGNLIP